MNELDEFIAGLINDFSINAIMDRNWFEIASILTPSVILILVLFAFSFLLQNKNWKIATYITCFLLTVLFLPYELFRQSAALSKAEANVSEMQTSLETLLNTSTLHHMQNLADQDVATSLLKEITGNLDQKEKKELIFISWLLAENEKQSLRRHEALQKSLAEDIQSSLDEAKTEIINTREPVDKISDTIGKQINEDISHLIENKMQSFNQAIDHSLATFQQGIDTYVQNELKAYEETLATLTQRGVEALRNELKNYTRKTSREFSNQIGQVNQESLQKIDETQARIDRLGNTVENINLDKIAAQIKRLSDSIELIEKQNDIRFEYHECMRSAGLIDLIGKEEECKKQLSTRMNDLNNQ